VISTLGDNPDTELAAQAFAGDRLDATFEIRVVLSWHDGLRMAKGEQEESACNKVDGVGKELLACDDYTVCRVRRYIVD
jgi:hypothetical protein